MSSEIKVRVLSWQDIYSHAAVLADKIMSSNWRPDVLVAIVRGGLVPTMLLSDLLNVKDILTLQLEHWPSAGTMEESVKIRHGLPDVNLDGKKVLIVDDIADTGDTLALAKSYISGKFPKCEVKTAALHVRKTRARFWPDYWGVVIEGDEWILYPWNYVEDLTSLSRRVMLKYGKVNVIELLHKLKTELNVDLSKVPLECMKFVLKNVQLS